MSKSHQNIITYLKNSRDNGSLTCYFFTILTMMIITLKLESNQDDDNDDLYGDDFSIGALGILQGHLLAQI